MGDTLLDLSYSFHKYSEVVYSIGEFESSTSVFPDEFTPLFIIFKFIFIM